MANFVSCFEIKPRENPTPPAKTPPTTSAKTPPTTSAKTPPTTSAKTPPTTSEKTPPNTPPKTPPFTIMSAYKRKNFVFDKKRFDMPGNSISVQGTDLKNVNYAYLFECNNSRELTKFVILYDKNNLTITSITRYTPNNQIFYLKGVKYDRTTKYKLFLTTEIFDIDKFSNEKFISNNADKIASYYINSNDNILC